MNRKQNCKYYDKHENCCRISSCSCGATLREREDDDDNLVDNIATGMAIASTISSLFDSSPSVPDTTPDTDWSGMGGDSGGGGADSSW